jgi:preprotein translocase subunit SecD
MRTTLITTLFAFVTSLLLAADLPVFELRAVAEGPSPTTEEYSLPQSDGTAETLNLESAVLLDRAALKSATVEKDQQGSPTIRIVLTQVGAKRFGEITERYRGKRLGIVVGGKLLSAPVVKEAMHGSSLEISGNFTEQEAADLAAKLNAAV